MVNVANGNLLIQADDMAVPNRGLEIAYRRTFNSQSGHDYNGTDGSLPSNYGNGWTSTFDTHIAANDQGSISVFDADGARYDYTKNGDGSYTPPAGQYAKLVFDGANGYYWVKKNGAQYYFYSPTLTSQYAGIAGRLYRIWGRNQNVYLAFAYSFDGGDASTYTKLNQVTVTTQGSPTRTATLSFADFSGHRLLQTLVWPDGTQVTYGYDAAANLYAVSEPGNNVASTLTQWYSQITSGGSNLTMISTPRWALSQGNDGEQLCFSAAQGSNKLQNVTFTGNIDPTVNDSSGNGPIQPCTTMCGRVAFRQDTFTYSITVPACTYWFDSDLHGANYCYDTIGRVTQTNATTGESSPQSLVTTQTWDASNNLIAQTDPNGNETDFVYDSNGNTVAVGEPSVKNVVSGSSIPFRPTTYYSYNGHNDVTSFCDPVWSHANSMDWGATPPPSSDTLCPTGTANSASNPGPTLYSWVFPSYEPYGELSILTTPMGYNTTYMYGPGGQGGSLDYGQVTKAQGDSMSETYNGPLVPKKTYTYDSYGDVICYGNGVGTEVLQYKAAGGLGNNLLGRVSAAADPDDGSIQSCNKPNSNYVTVSSWTYNADGSVATSSTPVQKAKTEPVGYSYDADGNVVSETRHYGGVMGVTNKYYDAADRLVEVAMPYSSTTDYYSKPWLTRYYYDLTMGGTVSVGDSAQYPAHGNMYKTVEYLPQTYFPPPGSNFGWQDLSGTAYDALDRPTAKYQMLISSFIGGAQYKSYATTLTYDGTSALGLLTTKCDPLGECVNMTYDSLNRDTRDSYLGDNGATADHKYNYDPDGRTAWVQVSVDGTTKQTFVKMIYKYDAEGKLTQKIEPSATYNPLYGSVSSPATISYTYFANGWRHKLSVTSPSLNQPNLFDYSYRADGLLTQQAFNYNNLPQGWTFNKNFTLDYTPGGRLHTIADPYTTFVIPNDNNLLFQPTIFSYDASGDLQSETLPNAGQYSISGTDAEGEVTAFSGYTLPTAPTQALSITNDYSVRGELVGQVVNGPVGATGYPYGYTDLTANGFLYPNSFLSGNNWSGDSVGFDPVNGVLLQLTYKVSGVPNAPTAFKEIDSYLYDVAGRNNTGQRQYYDQNNNPLPCPWFTCQWNASFDALNRQIDAGVGYTSTCSGLTGSAPPRKGGKKMTPTMIVGKIGKPVKSRPGFTPVYPGHNAWGAENHPAQMHSSNATDPTMAETVHWDGDQALFTTDWNGVVDDIKIGDFADITPSHVTVNDRDWTGTQVTAHNESGYYSWTPPDPYMMGCQTPSPNGVVATSGWNQDFVPIQTPRTDGVFDQVQNVQGVRAYQPQLATWSTPDALSGTVGDPQSNRAYVYVGDNPLTRADPSGLRFLNADDGIPVLGVVHVSAQTPPSYDDMSDADRYQMEAMIKYERAFAIGLIPFGARAPEMGGAEEIAADVRAAQTDEQLAAESTASEEAFGPNFAVSKRGVVVPIPKGATGPVPARNGMGILYSGGRGGNGLASVVSEVRIMNPNARNPTGYVNYGKVLFGGAWQTLNPYTGQPIPTTDPFWHYPL